MSAEATTTSYAVSAVEELPQLWDGAVKLVRAGLGISAFGANILDLPPNYTTESHDEADTGQQELYVALHGSGQVLIGDQALTLDEEHLVRVDAGVGAHPLQRRRRTPRPVRRVDTRRAVHAARHGPARGDA